MKLYVVASSVKDPACANFFPLQNPPFSKLPAITFEPMMYLNLDLIFFTT